MQWGLKHGRYEMLTLNEAVLSLAIVFLLIYYFSCCLFRVKHVRVVKVWPARLVSVVAPLFRLVAAEFSSPIANVPSNAIYTSLHVPPRTLNSNDLRCSSSNEQNVTK